MRDAKYCGKHSCDRRDNVNTSNLGRQQLASSRPLHSVSLLSQDIHGPEDREMLARLAASTEDDQSADSEAAIEKYLRSVLAVENILTLDRLRQVRKYSS